MMTFSGSGGKAQECRQKKCSADQPPTAEKLRWREWFHCCTCLLCRMCTTILNGTKKNLNSWNFFGFLCSPSSWRNCSTKNDATNLEPYLRNGSHTKGLMMFDRYLPLSLCAYVYIYIYTCNTVIVCMYTLECFECFGYLWVSLRILLFRPLWDFNCCQFFRASQTQPGSM